MNFNLHTIVTDAEGVIEDEIKKLVADFDKALAELGHKVTSSKLTTDTGTIDVTPARAEEVPPPPADVEEPAAPVETPEAPVETPAGVETTAAADSTPATPPAETVPSDPPANTEG